MFILRKVLPRLWGNLLSEKIICALPKNVTL